jgi:hypothetical protein
MGWAVPVGIANADCTTAGDFGASAGCAPPGSSSGSGNTESWPPTSVDWPPQLKSDSDSDGGGNGADAKPTPIVMPDGQKPPQATPSPIVAVGTASTGVTPSTSPTPTPIVTPQRYDPRHAPNWARADT